jgi:hypothetical protein
VTLIAVGMCATRLTVELVYKECPHVAATRTNLLRAFEAAGVPAKFPRLPRLAKRD